MKRSVLLSLTLLFFQISGFSQSPLREFVERQEQVFSCEYDHAIKAFKRLNFKTDYCGLYGRCLQLVRFQNGVPLFYVTHNALTADFISVVSSYEPSDWHEGLSGDNMVVGLWDAGHVYESHQEFSFSGEGRVLIEQETPSYKDHSTHVGGTIGACGMNTPAKGMAFNARILSKNYFNDLAEMGKEAGVRSSFISNHSYGPVSGWSFNSDEDQWYWHGDVGIDTFEDYKFGFYGSASAALDELANKAPYYLMVVSAGNDRGEGPETQPVSHKVWTDKWRGSNEIRDVDGGSAGYDCLGMNAVAKNVLSVGAVDAASNGGMAVFSVWGPSDDGRIKPDLTAPGVNVFSCLADGDDRYGYYSGTSMAAASVTGGTVLLQELQERLSPGVELSSSTLKGILIHTCDEAGLFPGPDYQYGWGIVNFNKAHELIEENISSGGALVVEGEAGGNGGYEHLVTLGSDNALKVTLVWNDLPGEANIPSLNPSGLALVNDLDLYIERSSDGAIYYPWVLDPDNPENQADKGVNLLDNVEQVVVDPGEAGEYIVHIDGSKIDDADQLFSLVISGHHYESGLFPPVRLDGFFCNDGVLLSWEPPVSGEPDFYQVYRNAELVGVSENLFYTDGSVEHLNSYAYRVAACYGNAESGRSCLSNAINIEFLPIAHLSIEEDFEYSPQWWDFDSDEYGWRWGDNASLSSYYLKFDGNTTHFMGINSDELGNGEHVSDYLISQPFELPESRKLEIGFRYFFNNNPYDTNDKLELLYRTSVNGSWVVVKSLPSVEGWSQDVVALEPEGEADFIQLAFYYDDHSEWGSGAAIDDFWVEEAEPLALSYGKNKQGGVAFYVDEHHYLNVFAHEGFPHAIEQVNLFDLKGNKVKSKKYGLNIRHVSIPLSSGLGRVYIVQVITSQGILSGKVISNIIEF